LEQVQERFPTDEATIRQGLLSVVWPGRLEVMIEQPTVIIDGAHNGEGVRALLDELGNFRGRKIKLLFAAMADKEWELMLAGLASMVDDVIFTKVNMDRSADPVEMERKFSDKITSRSVLNSRAGLQMLLDESRPDDVIVVAGSLYLLGEVRPMLQKIADSKLLLNM
jgi:dihydrofolate synthase/folylpolyglutamate synthase